MKTVTKIFAIVLVLGLVFGFAPSTAVRAATNLIVVTPATPDWIFYNDSIPPTTGDWTATFEVGPGVTPPLGIGSATIELNSALASIILTTQKYQGVRLADITALRYSTYTNQSPQAMTFQINYDPDVTSVEGSTWYGRLTYEPYMSGTVTNDTWQTWDMLTTGAKWWASGNANSTVDDACPQSAPCTLTDLLAAFPNIGIRNDTLSGIGFKAGSNWDGFAGNVDNFILTTAGDTDIYDFEPLSVAYVDDSWSSLTIGDDPDGSGPANKFGYDAFAVIQEGIDAVVPGGTVYVAAGTYNQALTINKALTLSGAGDEVTIVDGTGLTAETLLQASGLTDGALNISGFTFKDDPTFDAALIYPVSFSSCLTPATVIFSDNTILGTGTVDYDWGLLLGYGSTCSYTINNNVFDNIGGNSILVELATGPVEIGNNDFILPNDGYPAIFSMSYGTASVPNTVTGLHWYHDNNIYAKEVGGSFMSGIVISPAWGNGWNVRQYGSYTNVLIEDNTVEDFQSVGIQVEVDGENSTCKGVIQNNTLTAYPGISYSKGIRLLGPVSDTSLLGNIITNGYRGIFLSGTWGQPIYPTNITIEKNQLAANTIGFEEQDTVNDQDASPNWWGSASGPAAGYVVSNLNYIPWCTNEACTTFGAPVVNVTRGTYFLTIQAAIDDAATVDGDVIEVAAGTHMAPTLIDKSVTILGPNASIDPNGGSRVAEALLQGTTVAPALSLKIEIDAENVTFKGFTFDNVRFDNYYNKTGSNTLRISGIVIEKNIFTNVYGTAIYLHDEGDATTYDSGAVQIINNLIVAPLSAGAVDYNAGSGIILMGTSGSTISGNVISTAAYNGIQLARNQNITVSGNNITNSAQPAVQIAQWNDGINNISNNILSTTSTEKGAVRMYGFTNDHLPVFNFSSNTIHDSLIGIQIGHGDPGKSYNDIRDADYSFTGNTFTNIDSYRLVVYLPLTATATELSEMNMLFAQTYSAGSVANLITTADPYTYVAAPTTVWVDDSFTYSPESCGTHICGYDAFVILHEGIDGVAAGGTVNVAAGTYVEVGQIVIDKNLTIIGENKLATIIKPAQSTGSSGDPRGWWLVTSGTQLDLSNVTLDGAGFNIYQGIRSFGTGTIDNNIIKNIAYPPYVGYGVVVMGNYNMTFSNNTFTNIRRIGMMAYGPGVTNAIISGNTYTGKGVGDWLDYGVEIGGGAKATITGNTISNCLGVASTDGSASAGILVSNTHVLGSTATVNNNVLSNNTFGISVGTDVLDTSVVTATGNTFNGNQYHIRGYNATNISLPDALTNNTFEGAVTISGDYVVYSTIQGAIDGATDGDTILVESDTYNEAVLLNKPNITVRSTGGADVTIIDVPDGLLTIGVKAFRGLGAVTFDGFTVKDFTESGIVQGFAERDGTAFHVLNNKVIPADDYLRNGIQVSGDGSTVIGNYVVGAPLTAEWSGSGILVVDASNVLVQGNYVTGSERGLGIGIGVMNYTDPAGGNVTILENTVIDAYTALQLESYVGDLSVIKAEYNNFTGYIEPIFYYLNGGTISLVDASPNWWGSLLGPQGPINGDPTVIQWCSAPWDAVTDKGCEPLRPQTGNTLTLTGDLDLGEGNGIYVPGLTIILADGTTIEPTSGACFDINASYTTIEAATNLGAVCVPPAGENGVNVADGLVNVVINGLEFDGSAGGVDGIHFNGITDLMIIDNWFHDLTGDAIEFTAQPAGVVSIQGNLFQENDGLGINALTFTVPAEYNSWGHVGGADAGDGASDGVVTDPYTHVDLYLTASGVAPVGGTVTITVYGNLENVFGATFDFVYPTSLQLVGTPTNLSAFVGPLGTSTSVFTMDTGTRTITFEGYMGNANPPVSGVEMPLFSATFNVLATGGILNLVDTNDEFIMITDTDPAPSTNIYAYALVDGELINTAYTVIGKVTMQGRLINSGVPVALTGTGVYGPYGVTSIQAVGNNYTITGVAAGEYVFSTNQPRYLNLAGGTYGITPTVDVDGNITLPSLVLKGGNANWTNNRIDGGDASVIGTYYGQTIDCDGDVNFDGEVDITDLTLVGGNFLLTSANAYGSWLP